MTQPAKPPSVKETRKMVYDVWLSSQPLKDILSASDYGFLDTMHYASFDKGFPTYATPNRRRKVQDIWQRVCGKEDAK